MSLRRCGRLRDMPDSASVIFDSTVVPGTAEAVYLHASATQVDDPDVDLVGAR